ncbi:hypothetical protein [Nocardia sp. CA-119907]|uniref:hypothetical protein n=1 Tax=Nocardia sp. CA-119907 TaxID=3239973 RepID=UPI003D95195C
MSPTRRVLDARRLELERARISVAAAAQMTTPIYSVVLIVDKRVESAATPSC